MNPSPPPPPLEFIYQPSLRFASNNDDKVRLLKFINDDSTLFKALYTRSLKTEAIKVKIRQLMADTQWSFTEFHDIAMSTHNVIDGKIALFKGKIMEKDDRLL